MTRLIAVLLTVAVVLSVLASCNRREPATSPALDAPAAVDTDVVERLDAYRARLAAVKASVAFAADEKANVLIESLEKTIGAVASNLDSLARHPHSTRDLEREINRDMAAIPDLFQRLAVRIEPIAE